MFCPKCSKELPADSQFCLKCGHALISAAPAPVAAAPRPALRTKSYTARVVIFGTLLALVILFVANFLRTSNSLGPGAVGDAAALVLGKLPHTFELLTDREIKVSAGSYYYYRFPVPSGATNVSVEGHFSAVGGFGNDIEVFLLAADDFANFQNRHSASAYYNSGRVTRNSINATLPGSGTYYLVFNNRFSLLSPKSVQASAALHYSN